MDNLPTGYRVANGEHQNGPWKNRLVGASSPYLRQHADNPIDWRTWGGDAFAEAERRQVLIFLSVGYAACHWCHVMAHESFSDPRVARLLNERFVSIKVDREEHPDVDAFCMDTLLEMNGEAGWPATVFLTPERLPVQGGTYYPPYPRYGMPAFRDVLSSVESAWRRDPERVRKRARSRFDEMGQVDAVGGDDDDIITRGHDTILKTVDEERGGWGGGARFPMPPRLLFLLDQEEVETIAHTLDAMDRGGIHDHLGGGFHRYAVDPDWEIPHFEKMLYDNAQLAGVYLKAWALTGVTRWLTVAGMTLEHLCDDLARADGLLASSISADDPEGEGTYYTWTPDELEQVLGTPLGRAVAQAYSVSPSGNHEGRSVLVRTGDPGVLSVARSRMRAARKKRPAPERDDKAVVAWNAFAAAAFALAGRLLDEQRYLSTAQTIVRRLLDEPLGRVVGGDAPAVLSDFAALIDALFELHAADGDPRWLIEAVELGQQLCQRFQSADGRLVHGAIDATGLPEPRSQWVDHAEPAASAAGLLALQKLHALGVDVDVDFQPIIADGRRALAENPEMGPGFLRALRNEQRPMMTTIITGSPPLWEAARRIWRPRSLLIVTDSSPALAERFPTLRGKGPGRAWICEGTSCRLPIRSPQRLIEVLR